VERGPTWTDLLTALRQAAVGAVLENRLAHQHAPA
jgi:hypothetical protein